MNIVSSITQWRMERRRRQILDTLPRRILEDVGLLGYKGR